jgi:ribosome biogenesis GTPase
MDMPRQSTAPPCEDAPLPGRVLWASQGGYHVDVGPEVVFCQKRGRLRHGARETTAVAVGDEVRVQRNQDGTGLIVERLPRRSVLSRINVGRPGVEQVIAANVDQLVVVVSTEDPPLRERLIDRYLVAAHKGGLAPLLCVNKIDLADPEAIYGRIRLYEGLGYPIVVTSVTLPHGIGDLRAALAGRTSVFSGPSGGGKSSLLNALEPGLGLRVGEVSSRTHKGGHTTTSARLYRLADGAYVVDTPGLRELNIWDLLPEEVDRYFVEFQGRAAHCRFRSCRHLHEPGCAIRMAVEAGEIAASRYESYQRLVETTGDSTRR